MFARSIAASQRPTRNLDTYDPARRRQYEAFIANVTWRIPGGGQVFGGFTMERERQKACTAPDDPNYVSVSNTIADPQWAGQRFCDDFAVDIPFKNQFKLSGTRMIGWGLELSMAFQTNQSPTSTRRMTVTRGVTRYPTDCPSPCPAGSIIMPTGVFGQNSIVMYLEPERATFVERINQLDIKLARRFEVGRVTLLPVLEVFNVNNSDAIISYQTTNALSATYLAPEQHHAGADVGRGPDHTLVAGLVARPGADAPGQPCTGLVILTGSVQGGGHERDRRPSDRPGARRRAGLLACVPSRTSWAPLAAGRGVAVGLLGGLGWYAWQRRAPAPTATSRQRPRHGRAARGADAAGRAAAARPDGRLHPRAVLGPEQPSATAGVAGHRRPASARSPPPSIGWPTARRRPAIWRRCAPGTGFAVVTRRGVPYVDPASYARYDAIVPAATSVDPARLADDLRDHRAAAGRSLRAAGPRRLAARRGAAGQRHHPGHARSARRRSRSWPASAATPTPTRGSRR